MLAQLKIKDFAIIDDLIISFNEKMTVLTGETGSGKSIIIDAINLLLGERASNEMIRHEKEKAVIEGMFYYDNILINNTLTEFGIDYEDNTLIIVREVAKNGRNVCRINGSLVTVNQLKQIGNYLVDVHVQHDTTRLINTNNYLYLLDTFADNDFKVKLKKYQDHYHEYQEAIHQYNKVIKENNANQEKLDFYKYQFEEFKQANLKLEEFNELNNKRNLIANFDKIYDNLNKAYNNIRDQKILENIYESSNYLSKIAHINTKYGELSEQLINIYYLLDDNTNLLDEELSSLDYNPKELDSIESRLTIYSQFKRKYKMEIEQLIDYKNNLSEKINQIDNFEIIIKELKNKLEVNFQDTLNLALNLREIRENIAKEIETSLVTHLSELKLNNTNFKITFNNFTQNNINALNNQVFNVNGIDEVDFYVSFNKGEPTKPLSKVASGGELSRFMLALKTILSQKQNLSTIIFDEIDTGVSGVTAGSIAQKIKSISQKTQVLCITHLPQVASIADYHLYIAKEEKDNRTSTIVHYLEKDERVLEIAKMIAGDNLNDYVIENAKNLLNII
ncbi:MAG: recN [Haloplasmataceae bacterium]|nr:recN [Haloplasmataceae bacterium]